MFAAAETGAADCREHAETQPADEKAKIHLPPGFELQLVAAEPDIHKPLNMNFDDRGRLWLTDTLEYPYPPRRAARPRPRHDPRRLRPRRQGAEDYDLCRRVEHSDRHLAVQGGCIVHSIRHLAADRHDGDGKADKREVLYSSIGSRDTHGMTSSFTIGYDGWLYACHGYLNDSVLKGSDGQELRMNSGNTYRMRLDGSHCEINTRGQVNPFGLAWTASATCIPPTAIACRSRNCCTERIIKVSANRATASASPAHEQLRHHSTALCGLVSYDADQFPAEYRDRMFMCDVVFNRVNKYDITYTGSSPSAKFSKFLTSDDPWFRPVT